MAETAKSHPSGFDYMNGALLIAFKSLVRFVRVHSFLYICCVVKQRDIHMHLYCRIPIDRLREIVESRGLFLDPRSK